MKSHQDQIDETHPMHCEDIGVFEADAVAMRLVGERHEKRELVDLVRWLILRRPNLIDLPPLPPQPGAAKEGK